MTKVVLISQVPLPYSKIGSWTTLYKNYILSNENLIDYVICERPEAPFIDVKYSIVKQNIITKLIRKFTKKKYVAYIKALSRVLNKNERFVIQIVDNFYIVEHVLSFLKKEKLRKNCYIQFFYHSHPPFFDNKQADLFFNSIDELILLTHLSYKAHKDYYKSLPVKVSILHNGIDNNIFFRLNEIEKKILKLEFNVDGRILFIWCSQDRPKKGLSIILEAWKMISLKYSNVELWVIGCETREYQKGVTYLGKIPNDDLAKYLQVADCYLFSSLCQEGFPLSLTEALHCGNYCIASNVGGVSEVLNFGEFGTLIDNPHFINDWIIAIENYLEKRYEEANFPESLYTHSEWTKGMNLIISKAINK